VKLLHRRRTAPLREAAIPKQAGTVAPFGACGAASPSGKVRHSTVRKEVQKEGPGAIDGRATRPLGHGATTDANGPRAPPEPPSSYLT